MKKYEVWMQAFVDQGDCVVGGFLGEAEAESFEEACVKVMQPKQDEYWSIKNPTVYWGCMLVDNETEALENLPENRRAKLRRVRPA